MITPEEESLLIITGGNRGLGHAFIKEALDTKSKIISLARALDEEHRKFINTQLFYCPTDLTKPFDADALSPLLDGTSEHISVFVILNAAQITPLIKVGDYENKDISSSVMINVLYNASLINFVIKRFPKNKLTLVNISSGASRKAIENWSLYCASKAYMEMFFQTIRLENQYNERISIFSIDPGAMDTGMQENIRMSSAPSRDYFESLAVDQKLKKPEVAAKEILSTINFK